MGVMHRATFYQGKSGVVFVELDGVLWCLQTGQKIEASARLRQQTIRQAQEVTLKDALIIVKADRFKLRSAKTTEGQVLSWLRKAARKAKQERKSAKPKQALIFGGVS